MEEQIKSEFKRSGFGLEDEQEILSKCKRILNNDDDTKDNTPGTPINHHQDPLSPALDTTSLMYENVLSSGKPSKSKLITPFSKRTDKFVVKFSINTVPKVEKAENDEDDVLTRVPLHERCSLSIHRSGPKPGCRFLYDRTEDRLNAIENRLRKYTRAFVASGLYEEPTDPTTASQIVGIGGHNPSGHCFVASKLVDSIPTYIANEDSNPAKKQAVDKENQPTDLLCKERELSMIIAAGPFTTTDNLLFEPLIALLTHAKLRPPQLLVLLGPFVDSEHPDIKKGTVDRSFDEIFEEILKKLEEYVDSATRVVLVPSIRDANHDFVFPQLDAVSREEQVRNNSLSIGFQVKVGCCTVDILKQISGEEISRTAADGKPIDRLSRLANHILNQQSFYPLYPPAEGVPLDFSLAPEALQLSSIPDILILPSDIKYFVKVLSSENEGINHTKCIAVNPGRLAKGEGGGTFVELDYCGGSDQINASVVGI
ncbi:hypothetical protein JHK85_049628 [Glycine max]|nr:hypothetical protein JHK85_049628 [Glycine max]